MPTMPSWFWIAVVDVGFFVAGLSVLWFFARRALRDDVDDERSPRARSRTMMQVLEYRIERLLLRPPSWADIARRLRPYLVGVLGVTVGGLVLWGIWTHAGSWFAEAPAPPRPSSNGSGLPWESAFDKMHNALSGPIAYFFVAIGLAGGIVTLALGESRRAAPFIAVVLGAFFMIKASDFVAILGEPSQSESASSWTGRADQPATLDSTELATSADETETEAVAEQMEPMPQLEAAEAGEFPDESNELHGAGQTPLETTTTHRHVTSERQSHFGFSDALMMYGAYKLLTHESEQRAPVGAAPQHTAPPSAAPRTQVLAPRQAVSAPPQPKARVRSVFRPSRSRRSR